MGIYLADVSFASLVQQYGMAVRAKLNGPGEPEAALASPVEALIGGVGNGLGLKVVSHNEVREMGGSVRPDFGVRVEGLLTGHVELKAPGTPLDPETYPPESHNGKQWRKLRELPNLLHTNGTEWRLWRYGELVDKPAYIHAKSLQNFAGVLTAEPKLEQVISNFLRWKPTPIFSVSKLVDTLAPLARMLKEEVREELRREDRAVRNGADKELQPFLGLSQDWRAMLFPNATHDEFSDGFAQTVVFALVLAISEGIDLGENQLHEVANMLSTGHTLMGRSLGLLTEHINASPTGAAVETVTRTLSAVDWNRLSSGKQDIYLHLYEHFLGSYDPVRREKTGSYYTPIEVVEGMVRLTDDALKKYFDRPEGLRDPNVSIVDPAMGTGTYPLSVLRHVSEAAAKQYGPGAASEAASSLMSRLYGIELQSGPFSVAELRLSGELAQLKASIPGNGLNLYVADTLEDPNSGSKRELSYSLKLIARQRQKANDMKRDTNVQVVIGNPPYDDRAGGRGGWIENGIDPQTNKTPMHAFKKDGNGRAEFTLSNLYVYFWRWATWKAFESTAHRGLENGDTGIISFITATGYLTGPGFKGMREYLRHKASHGWIINLTPEGKRPPAKNQVFGIETPVAIGIFARVPGTSEENSAEIKYIDFHGTKEEKFLALANIDLNDESWRTTRAAWDAPFTPVASTDWDTYPALSDIFPWFSTGVTPNRNWVISPSKNTLEHRLNDLILEGDSEKKKTLFKETRDSSIYKSGRSPLPGDDVEKNTFDRLAEQTMITVPKTVRMTFRAFDRQWLIADRRLLDMPRPPLWEARQIGQVYVIEQHSIHPKAGPGVHFSAFMPDINAFNNRGGRTLPMLHPSGEYNLAKGLTASLSKSLNMAIENQDIIQYIAAVVSHPHFVEQFSDELNTPGIRVPITEEPDIWRRAVCLGREVLIQQTFGAYGEEDPSLYAGIVLPRYEESVGDDLPAELKYISETQDLVVGSGRWSNVTREVVDYKVGGVNVLDSWFGYRKANPRGKISSPLDEKNPFTWEMGWSRELSELLQVLTKLVSLEESQESLLNDVTLSRKLTTKSLVENGFVVPGPKDSVRKPKKRDSSMLPIKM